jgi:hypothetical protein
MLITIRRKTKEVFSLGGLKDPCFFLPSFYGASKKKVSALGPLGFTAFRNGSHIRNVPNKACFEREPVNRTAARILRSPRALI